MKKKKLFALCMLCVVLLASCAGLKETVNLTKCNFSYHKIGQLNFMNVDLSNGFSLASVQQMLSAFSSDTKQVPLGFTVYMKVDNPNTENASLEKLAYKVSLDGVEFTEGVTTAPFTVAGKSSADMALPITIDIKQMLSGESRTVVMKIVKNFVGINAEPVDVKVQLKPSFRVGKKGHLTVPAYIPVTFQYNGKTKQ
ncbi:MAG: LEA type 2 family protein [Bacteroidales bacterium]|nr:LEA type 2 family protein [Bacteroidales bacterium]